MDVIRDRFGTAAVNYAAAMGGARSVPDAFRSLAEKKTSDLIQGAGARAACRSVVRP